MDSDAWGDVAVPAANASEPVRGGAGKLTDNGRRIG
jgi:hypothetical protein